eukprot:CAMPEP_0119271792 /NCGR_PEP_ID=MMETSP1329-20130426/8237_1 /TAXON_ID=114041 /ORGANISM="Genus nov. species nov., Strain RCC1024" /LENGTH=259 /DNA_ID=CAMNT_0007271845 /DNA_START=159 /DNA_END=935 /DNA_ORIENTATION=-
MAAHPTFQFGKLQQAPQQAVPNDMDEELDLSNPDAVKAALDECARQMATGGPFPPEQTGTFFAPNEPVTSFAGVNAWTAASDGDMDKLRIMIDSGAHRPDEPDEQGYTCLHAAASYGHHEMLKYLLTGRPVNPNCRDEDGDTPLHVCEDVESVNILLAHGADPSLVNSDGWTPADTALHEERMAVEKVLRDADPYQNMSAPQNVINRLQDFDEERHDLQLSDLAAMCGKTPADGGPVQYCTSLCKAQAEQENGTTCNCR